GGQTVFYQWLFYTERLSGEFEHLAHKILATRLWNFLALRSGGCPESLPVTDIQVHCLNTEVANGMPTLKRLDPPAAQSLWREFVLDLTAYEMAVARLDELIQDVLLHEADRAIFKKEHRF